MRTLELFMFYDTNCTVLSNFGCVELSFFIAYRVTIQITNAWKVKFSLEKDLVFFMKMRWMIWLLRAKIKAEKDWILIRYFWKHGQGTPIPTFWPQATAFFGKNQISTHPTLWTDVLYNCTKSGPSLFVKIFIYFFAIRSCHRKIKSRKREFIIPSM
jgi:hypothetical protein